MILRIISISTEDLSGLIDKAMLIKYKENYYAQMLSETH